MLSLTIPFFGYNSSNSTQNDKYDSVVDDVKDVLKQKLDEADQLFLVNKYEDVVHLLEDHKVILIYCFTNLQYYFIHVLQLVRHYSGGVKNNPTENSMLFPINKCYNYKLYQLVFSTMI